MKKGSLGSDVKQMQEALKKIGYRVVPDGRFGTNTDLALREFQRKNGLLSDGIAGPRTLALLLGNAPADVQRNIRDVSSRLGITDAVIAGLARKPPTGSRAPTTLTTSEKGLKFLYEREAMKNVSNRLHWPKGASGVTLGPGYDMRERSRQTIIDDLVGVGVARSVAEKIAEAAGLRGSAAETFARDNKSLVNLDKNQEMKLMRSIIGSYEKVVRNKVKTELTDNEFDALVSYAYNTGTIHKNVAKYLNDGQIVEALNEMKKHNTSGGEFNAGLAKRRDLEIDLFLGSGNAASDQTPSPVQLLTP